MRVDALLIGLTYRRKTDRIQRAKQYLCVLTQNNSRTETVPPKTNSLDELKSNTQAEVMDSCISYCVRKQ